MSQNKPTHGYRTYRLYRSEQGTKYHRKATCATQSFMHPYLDGGEDLFERVELFTTYEADPSAGELCGNCCSEKFRAKVADDDI